MIPFDVLITRKLQSIIMTSQYVWIGIAIGVFVAGIGIGYTVFINTYNPYAMMMGNPAMFNQMMGRNPQFSGQYMGYMMQNPQYMNQWMSQNPQYVNQWMGSMMQDPQLRQQMFNYMSKNQNYTNWMMNNPQYMNQWMSQMMSNPNFRQQYMGPWMMIQNPKNMGPMMSQWYSQYPQGNYIGLAIKTDQVSILKESWTYNTTLAYMPSAIQVSPGTTVTWTNNDYVVHTVTDTAGTFDSDLIQPQNTWKHTFDSKGTYNYFCTLHPWMKGEVIVQ